MEEVEEVKEYFYCLECSVCQHRRYDLWITAAGMRCASPSGDCPGRYMVRLLDHDPFENTQREGENNV